MVKYTPPATDAAFTPIPGRTFASTARQAAEQFLSQIRIFRNSRIAL